MDQRWPGGKSGHPLPPDGNEDTTPLAVSGGHQESSKEALLPHLSQGVSADLVRTRDGHRHIAVTSRPSVGKGDKVENLKIYPTVSNDMAALPTTPPEWYHKKSPKTEGINKTHGLIT